MRENVKNYREPFLVNEVHTPRDLRARVRENFFKLYNINSPHDQNIIMNLAELVKEQQMRTSGHIVAPIVHLDFASCMSIQAK
jgi:hypothetical protein